MFASLATNRSATMQDCCGCTICKENVFESSQKLSIFASRNQIFASASQLATEEILQGTMFQQQCFLD